MRYCIFSILMLVCSSGYTATIGADKLFKESENAHFRISPEGDYLAHLKIVDDIVSVLILEPNGEQRYEVFKLEDNEKSGMEAMMWMDTDSLLIKYRDQFRLTHYHIVDCKKASDGSLSFMTHDTVLIADLIDPLPGEQDTVMISVHIPGRGRLMDVYKVDLRQVNKNYVFPYADRLNAKIKDGIGYGTDGQHRLRFAVEDKDKERNYLYLDVKEDKWKTFFSIEKKPESDKDEEADENEEEEASIEFIGFIDDQKMAVATNYNRDKMAVMEFDLKNQKFGKVLYESSRYDVEYAQLEPSTGALRMVAISDAGRISFKYFSSKDKELLEKLNRAFPKKKSVIYDASSDGKKVIIKVFSETNPGTFYFLDTQTLNARPLADDSPDLADAKFSPSQMFMIRSKDNLEIESFITIPADSVEKHPLIVMPHGGPIGVRDYDLWDPEVQFFADRGFAVLRVNYRGSGGYGKSFASKGVGQWGKGIEDDIELSVKHAIENYPIDKDRICIVGASYGGYSALMSSIRSPDNYKCVVSRFGVTDLNLVFNETNTRKISAIRKAWERVIVDPDNSDADLREVSPFYLASKLNVPVLLTAGWNDYNVDPEQTNRMKVALELLGKPYEYLLYMKAGHGHPKWTGDQHEMILIERFVRKILEIEDPQTYLDRDIRMVEDKIVQSQFSSGEVIHEVANF